MKHAPNYQPYKDQCEGWLRLVNHKPGRLPIGDLSCIVTDCIKGKSEDGKSIFGAKCIKNEPGCSYMETLDGRCFRITEHSEFKAYFAYFENKTDNSRDGSKFKNRYFNISSLNIFMNSELRSYIIYDITLNEFAVYPQKEERSDIVWGGVAKNLNFNWHVEMTDKGFRA